MTWIERRPPSPQHPEVLAAFRAAMTGYPPEYDSARAGDNKLPETVRSDSIVLAHSLVPGALQGMFEGFRALLDPALPLSRRQHELIATVVSRLNDCFY